MLVSDIVSEKSAKLPFEKWAPTHTLQKFFPLADLIHMSIPHVWLSDFVKIRHKALFIGSRAAPGSPLSLCSLCANTQLTHEHLLWECPLARSVWAYAVRKSSLPTYVISSVIDVLEIGGINLRSRDSPVSTVMTVRLHMCAIHCIIKTMYARSSARSPVTLATGRIMLRQMLDRWFSLVAEASTDYRLPKSFRRR
mmetsp:Transcript_2440/g.3734  ORF Transcript_2440/g.3734 Transcript_2440/m.3734 type:complete len:196 (+) Transcript_2440:600-1187(+)